MAVTPYPFAKFQLSMATQLVNLDTDDFRMMLLDSCTIGSLQSDAQFVADVLAHATQTAGTGYTAGGLLVSAPALSLSGLVLELDTATDLAWPGSTFSPGPAFALLYDATPGTDAANPVIALYDLDGPKPVTDATFTLTINPAGLATFTAAA